ncbi:VWA domain-containing protein [Pantoea sp. Pa-EAmG]|uniref:VWA domain-containing protein n=2 Tax=Pantoea TaxID=53335 RepID=UPI0024AEDEB8|nr:MULTISPECIES: VWA domain-containing protein [unclassified Pantoea]MDI6957545.1 VWA domain-containing protein [Pantoea sp. Pa-EAmG]MDI9221582.1 VWA domain-containing protein [Pantoea sp. EA-12]
MTSFHFLQPWWLLTLPLCLLLAWWLKAPRSVWHRIMDKPFARAMIIRRSNPPLRLVPWIIALAGIALAGPSWHKQLPDGVTPQSNVMIILQQDFSMLAQDLPPNRHQRMQHKLMLLMQQMPGSRFGLIVYRNGAWLTTPLTRDPAFYALFLNAQQPTLMPEGEGEGLRAALALADKSLPATPRSMVLVADTLAPDEAAWLGQQSYPLQLWVPGTARGGALPETYAQRGIDTRLNVSRFSQIRDNGIPVTLASGTDDDDISAIRKHIQTSLTQQENHRHDLPWHNSGYWLAVPILFLVLFWRRQGMLVVLLAFTLSGLPSDARSAWLDAWISPDIQGQRAFKAGHYAEAAQHYQDPLRQGIAFYYARDFSAASAAFLQAPLTPENLVWLANSLAQQKKWQQALNTYDQALSLRPDWQIAQHNRALIADIIMKLRQQERDRQAEQGKEKNYDPDEVKNDLKKDQGAEQKDLQPIARAALQVNQWYENLTVSPGGLLENFYRSSGPEAP